ncbi:isoleucine-tRNA ligase [Schizosaccharomyces cryophilus OY26]|uniref:isoleucine--tRNA ligase n=1 Tax=Schizosaccharomyces cryophilus (strain OY26 / ATCC MYA-4695 / CBS 11777 / NBRC 106824 / NRRL Y48691) TaxID=653667 RepID=S9X807_SCHCR|nr:isoleucine-tRNA ligase [Schizosaccharomyces cryophilus OY26]EPY49851.1 isoleucine-tRNA ligase [Schizosaccharomyces cryophilus OY26]
MKAYIENRLVTPKIGLRFLSQQANAKKYSNSLCLPKTNFPIRSDERENEKKYMKEITDDLYSWQKKNLPSSKSFVLLDGPPYANGKLHIGHALNKILKDIVNRWKLLNGYQIRYVPGWDCHGLPIELKAVQQNDKEGSPCQIRKTAKEFAENAMNGQMNLFRRLAVMGDWFSRYTTMSHEFQISELQVFQTLVEKEMVFRQLKPVYWSPSSRSALAESEIEYNDNHVSFSLYFSFPVNNFTVEGKPYENVKALIWTTTPWTVPSNLALAFHPGVEYGIFSNGEQKYIVAKSLVNSLPILESFEEIETCTYDTIRSLTYQNPLIPGKVFPFLPAEYVSDTTGTGIVHVAPGHGMDDYLLGLEHSLPPFSPVDDNGVYTKDALGGSLFGLNVLNEGGKQVLELMKANGMVVQLAPYKHRYPYDWRNRKPLILRATAQWFISLEAVKDKAIEALQSVKMIPLTGKSRLSGFLNSRPEWCISRQRSWGLPIPVLYEKASGKSLLTSRSISYIIDKMKVKGVDAWFNEDENIDWVPPEFRNKDYVRGKETLDVWFDSGSGFTTVPFRKDKPLIDLCLEGSDQHRGWFQSLILIYLAVTGIKESPFQSLFTHGFVFDEKGMKQSKSLGNVTDPEDILDGKNITSKKQLYGIDLLRLWVGSCDSTNDINLGPNLLNQVGESLKKWRLTCRFCLGNLGDFSLADEVVYNRLHRVDQLAVAKTSEFQNEVKENYNSLAFNKVVQSIFQYMNSFLSSTYFDSIKDRLYSDAPNSLSRRSAQTTLYKILLTLLWSMSPIVPLLSQEVWRSFPKALQPSYSTPFHAGTDFLLQDLQKFVKQDKESLLEEHQLLLKIKYSFNLLLQEARNQHGIRSPLETETIIGVDNQGLQNVLKKYGNDLSLILGASSVRLHTLDITSDSKNSSLWTLQNTAASNLGKLQIRMQPAQLKKCLRCWMHTVSEGEVCQRCNSVMSP